MELKDWKQKLQKMAFLISGLEYKNTLPKSNLLQKNLLNFAQDYSD